MVMCIRCEDLVDWLEVQLIDQVDGQPPHYTCRMCFILAVLGDR